jgi:pimeloyl-ACP methyl ester carboxylesterase
MNSIGTAATLIICFLLLAGCMSTPAVPEPAQAHSSPEYPAVSIKATPVQYAEVNGVRLGYREFGTGEPLLVIIGFGATMDQGNDTCIAVLASKYHVYLYDHRGMGYSSTDTTTPSISGYADDATGLMKALGYDRMHLYGISMGSFIAQQIAIDHPERVRNMVLDSGSYSIRIPETAGLLAFIETAAADPATPTGVRNEARAMLAWNGTENQLSTINKSVLFIVGTNDTITPEVLSVRMAGQVPGSWLVRFKGLPHAAAGEAPVVYGRTILFFLDTNESPLNR